MASKYYSVADAAKIKNVSRATIYSWIDQKLLNAETVAGRMLVCNDDKFEKHNRRAYPPQGTKSVKQRVAEIEDTVQAFTPAKIEELQKVVEAQGKRIEELEEKLAQQPQQRTQPRGELERRVYE